MIPSVTLAEIARQIDDGKDISASDHRTFSHMINATGPLNSHLRLTLQPRRYERDDPIDMSTEIRGGFLTVLYDCHWPRLTLNEHHDRAEMAEFIIDHTSVVCEVFAFENCTRLRYRIEYDGSNGPRRHYQPNVPTPAVHWMDT
ncbi:MAG: hypothetical protein ABL888_23460 [Pirellulaceae bacterium]